MSSKSIRKLLLGLGKILFVCFCIGGGFVLGLKLVEYKQTFPANSDQFSAVFPVAVVYFDDTLGKNVVEVVEQKNLMIATSAHPGYTFLIPTDQEKELNDSTGLHDRGILSPIDYSSTTPWSTGFKVEKYTPSEQRIQAWYDVSEDYSNVGWYIATKDSIKPERHRYLGPGTSFLIFPFGLVGGVTGVVILRIIKRLYRKRHQVPSEYNVSIDGASGKTRGFVSWGLFAVLISCVLVVPKSYITSIFDPSLYGTEGRSLSSAALDFALAFIWSPIYFIAGCIGAYFIQKFLLTNTARITAFVIFIALLKIFFI